MHRDPTKFGALLKISANLIVGLQIIFHNKTICPTCLQGHPAILPAKMPPQLFIIHHSLFIKHKKTPEPRLNSLNPRV
jgi:hypothetical protein